VSITPFGWPVVPLEYGSAATSVRGSTSGSPSIGSLSMIDAIVVMPSASPATQISSRPTRPAASRATSSACGIVTRNRAPASLSWNATSSAL
jgi:hypothetical protein